MLVPGIGALFFEPFDDVAERGVVFEPLAAAIAKKHDDRHAPEALAGNTPVGALFDHFVNALFAPAGNPFHVLNFTESLDAQRLLAVDRNSVHSNEPLFRGTKDHGVVAAPAVRVAVFIGMMAKERAAVREQLYDNRIRGENVFALVLGQAFKVDALVVERRVNFEAILLAGVKVVGAVTGRGVNDSGSLI